MSQPRTLTLLGSQSSGKSTYLGALVDALQLEKIRHLRLGDLADDASALLQLPVPLHEGRYPQRTVANQRVNLEAPLRTHGDFFEDSELTLRIGDYDGEEVERLFKDRIHGWTEDWRKRAQSEGLMLIVRPSTLRNLPQLQTPPNDDSDRWSRLSGNAVSPAPAFQPAPITPHPELLFAPVSLEDVPAPPRAASSAPVQVPTVLSSIELLQFIRHVRELAPGERPRGDKRMRIALLVSAWDSVDPAWRRAGPTAYVSQNLHLLADYLWSNFPPDDVYFFGLSATGGDLNDADYAKRYLNEPSGFVEWTESTGLRSTPDIGLPLYWLLFGDRAFGAV
jgi:hypothetical protein